MIYTTKDGEVLDYIVWKHYGKTAGILEQVLKINRHLEKYNEVLPIGIAINLPNSAPPANNQKIKMWQ